MLLRIELTSVEHIPRKISKQLLLTLKCEKPGFTLTTKD